MSAIALDPLIAEAKRRARRRRLLAAVVIAAGVSAVVWATLPSGRPAVTGSTDVSPATLAPIWSFDVRHRKSGWYMSTVGPSGLSLSANEGTTWHRVPGPGLHGSYPRFISEDYLDLKHVWLEVNAGSRIAIERTSDGGRTWSRSYLPRRGSEAGFDGFGFRTRTSGYLEILTGGSAQLRSVRFATKDGGATWTRVPQPSTLLRRRHAVKVYVPGAPSEGDQIGALERTDDYGRHWTPVRLPGNPDLKELKTFGRTLVLVGLVFEPKGRYRLALYVSKDAGNHWSERLAPRQIQPGGPQDACCFYVSAPAAGAVYALSDPKGLYVTHDVGRTWHGFRPSGLFPVTGEQPAEFISARVGFSIRGTRRTMLVRTTDGGRHWTPVGPRKPQARRHG